MRGWRVGGWVGGRAGWSLGPEVDRVPSCHLCNAAPPHRALASNMLFTNLTMGDASGFKRGFFNQGPGGSPPASPWPPPPTGEA